MNKQPNILIILTDQQNANMMSCSGNTSIKTPSLDKLANEGTRFTRAVCSNPVCIPSRFSLFTGKLPSTIGMKCNADSRTIPKVGKKILYKGMGYLLQNAGYKTFYGGKEHLPTFTSKDIGFEYICKDERETLATKSSEFLRNSQENPFVLVVSFINPHDICYMAINDYKNKQSKFKEFISKLGLKHKKIETANVDDLLKDIEKKTSTGKLPPLPENHQPQENEPEAVRSLFKRKFRQFARENWDETKWRQHRYVYGKLTEKVDAEIGQVLKALENGPNSNNTVVIFTSDHGDHDASHKLEHKTAFYSEAVNIPFLMKWDNVIPKGKTVSKLINNGLDLIPTVCDIAGIEPPKELMGKSAMELAKGGEKSIWKWTPVENEIGKALWSEDWAYVLYDEGEYREQLYDLKNDPGQTRNHMEEYPEILEECRKEMKKFWPISENERK